jgi:hypothetical protein
MHYIAGIAAIGDVSDIVAVCDHCRRSIIARRLFVQAGRERKPVNADGVSVLIARDKCVELWANGQMAGLMPGASPSPTLESTAAKLGGHWVSLSRDTWCRPESISYWRSDEKGGANVVADSLAVHSSRRRWPHVRRLLEKLALS